MSGYMPPHHAGDDSPYSNTYAPGYELTSSAPSGPPKTFHCNLPGGEIPYLETRLATGKEGEQILLPVLGFGLWGWGDVSGAEVEP